MTTQTVERQDLHQAIDALPDEAIAEAARYIESLQEVPNAETIAAIEELRAGKGKKFHSIEALMADLHDENDA
jgi:antitoxin component of RelBE/YafQ-DinJ toxin-antitoxin module